MVTLVKFILIYVLIWKRLAGLLAYLAESHSEMLVILNAMWNLYMRQGMNCLNVLGPGVLKRSKLWQNNKCTVNPAFWFVGIAVKNTIDRISTKVTLDGMLRWQGEWSELSFLSWFLSCTLNFRYSICSKSTLVSSIVPLFHCVLS